jgi:hypothetical protein
MAPRHASPPLSSPCKTAGLLRNLCSSTGQLVLGSRIHVTGNSCSGKSYVASRLAAIDGANLKTRIGSYSGRSGSAGGWFVARLAPFDAVIGVVAVVLGVLNIATVTGLVLIASGLILAAGALAQVPTAGHHEEGVMP